MAAVIGLNEVQVIQVLAENNLNAIDVANYNAPTQIVISGYREDIEKARPIFEAINAVRAFRILDVSGAFHSRYMREVKQEFERFLQAFNLYPLSLPVISNVYARPYEQGRLKRTLAEQITSSVKWTESIRFLMQEGEMVFEEIGPGTILTGLIQKIKREAVKI
jgi:malonyl CoA-acyl carrier protein transacylase